MHLPRDFLETQLGLAAIVAVLTVPTAAILYFTLRRRPGYRRFWSIALLTSGVWSGWALAVDLCAQFRYPTFLVGDGAGFLFMYVCMPGWILFSALVIVWPPSPPADEGRDYRVLYAACAAAVVACVGYMLWSIQPWR